MEFDIDIVFCKNLEEREYPDAIILEEGNNVTKMRVKPGITKSWLSSFCDYVEYSVMFTPKENEFIIQRPGSFLVGSSEDFVLCDRMRSNFEISFKKGRIDPIPLFLSNDFKFKCKEKNIFLRFRTIKDQLIDFSLTFGFKGTDHYIRYGMISCLFIDENLDEILFKENGYYDQSWNKVNVPSSFF
jgi:hypothetical protein